MCGKMKRWDMTVQTYQQILRKVEARSSGYERLRPTKVYSEMARSQIELHKEDDAIATFSKVTAAGEATPNEKAQAHLWMGKIFDVKKDRPTALRHYNEIPKLDCDPDFKREAEGLKRKPFGT